MHKRLDESEVQMCEMKNDEIRKENTESEIYGADGKESFNEYEFATVGDIVQIKVWCGDLIDAIQVVYTYETGGHHGGNGGTLRVLQLSTDEKITTVRGTTTTDIISSLTFCTDYGREETFGVSRGDGFEFEMTDGYYLGAIKGYDAYHNGSKNYPKWEGDFQLLPALGFIAKV